MFFEHCLYKKLVFYVFPRCTEEKKYVFYRIFFGPPGKPSDPRAGTYDPKAGIYDPRAGIYGWPGELEGGPGTPWRSQYSCKNRAFVQKAGLSHAWEASI